jgi:hypothetical protein
MTYKELCDDVLALGFEVNIEDGERLLFAARRALNLIFTERPLYKTLELYENPKKPTVKLSDFLHRGGEIIEIPFSQRAYSFTAHGEGSYRITDSSGERVIDFKNGIAERGFLYGEGKIEFLGDYLYTVTGFALYNELFGSKSEDIPLADGKTEHEIIRHAPDFLSATDSPRDKTGRIIKGASVSGGKLFLPADFCGAVRLEYKLRAPEINGNSDEDFIVPEGCSHLVGLLTSAYYWLDDDAEKAEYYMSLYREAMIAVKLYTRPKSDAEYSVTDGWA